MLSTPLLEFPAEASVLIPASGARKFKAAKKAAPPWAVSPRAWVGLSRYSLTSKGSFSKQ